MATKKQTGYLVKIEAFVPADLTDMNMLTKVQDVRMKASMAIEALGGVSEVGGITPTRR